MAIYVGHAKKPETIIGESYYVGRPSPLGNPYPIVQSKFSDKIYTLDESIKLYRRWLWVQIRKLGKSSAARTLAQLARIAREKDITLVCWCAGTQYHKHCHAWTIKGAIEWLNKDSK